MPTLDFKGKQIIYAHHLTVASRPLEVDAKKSLPPKSNKPSLDDNLIIHGDNLHALKALMPRYAGRVNCIYIDPPYNTGNEKWVYNDNVNSPMMKEWLKGKSPVDGEDLERHDKWLCMMWPRLQLLRELLAEDGVIFVSIDDNEQHHLRMMMDEVFGGENFVANIIWQKAYSPRMDATGFSSLHDHILSYQKSDAFMVRKETFMQDKTQFNFYDKKKKKYYRRRSLRKEGMNSLRQNAPNCYYPLKTPDGKQIYPIKPNGVEGCWRWAKSTYEYEKSSENIEWVKNSNSVWQVYAKQYYEGKAVRPPTTLWLCDDVGHNHEANDEIRALLGTRVFDSPKPKRLIKKCLMAGADKDAIILDSFAGSGTTAHATLALNKEDGGNRKFILVECEDYANKITAERVRRVIKGVPKTKDESLKKGLGGSFTYCTLGDEMSIEKMLTGKNLPDYETLARHIFWTATGQSADKIRKARGKDGFFHETKDRLFYLIYEPKLAFLRNGESALNSERAERISKQAKAKKKTAIVFATHKFMGQKELTEMGIVFCGLPYGMEQKFSKELT